MCYGAWLQQQHATETVKGDWTEEQVELAIQSLQQDLNEADQRGSAWFRQTLANLLRGFTWRRLQPYNLGRSIGTCVVTGATE